MLNGLKETFAELLQAEAGKLAALRDDEYLGALRRLWDVHDVALPLVRDVLLFMVRPRPASATHAAPPPVRPRWLTQPLPPPAPTRRPASRPVPQERYFLNETKQPSVYELGMSAFRDHVVNVRVPGQAQARFRRRHTERGRACELTADPPRALRSLRGHAPPAPLAPQIRAVACMLELVERERNGDEVDRSQLKTTAAMLSKLGTSPARRATLLSAHTRLMAGSSRRPGWRGAGRPHSV